MPVSVVGHRCNDALMAMFAVTTARGPAWDGSAGVRDQRLFAEHARFMDDLVDHGVVVIGGPIESESRVDVALLAIEADAATQVDELFADDPWIVQDILVLKSIRAWTIWLDGRPRRG
jgi:hypothetical protein